MLLPDFSEHGYNHFMRHSPGEREGREGSWLWQHARQASAG